eukprot:scaffold24723_cov131-Isochrysis_galbana.AAC.8
MNEPRCSTTPTRAYRLPPSCGWTSCASVSGDSRGPQKGVKLSSSGKGTCIATFCVARALTANRFRCSVSTGGRLTSSINLSAGWRGGAGSHSPQTASDAAPLLERASAAGGIGIAQQLGLREGLQARDQPRGARRAHTLLRQEAQNLLGASLDAHVAPLAPRPALERSPRAEPAPLTRALALSQLIGDELLTARRILLALGLAGHRLGLNRLGLGRAPRHVQRQANNRRTQLAAEDVVHQRVGLGLGTLGPSRRGRGLAARTRGLALGLAGAARLICRERQLVGRSLVLTSVNAGPAQPHDITRPGIFVRRHAAIDNLLCIHLGEHVLAAFPPVAAEDRQPRCHAGETARFRPVMLAVVARLLWLEPFDLFQSHQLE